MPKKGSRIILDTNLWISFLISKDLLSFDELIFSKHCILVFSEELLLEFIEVAKRPKFKRYFSTNDIEYILESINGFAEFISVKTKVDSCRDSKDNFLLSLAIDGKADYLLTGDSDLLEIKKIGKTKIITIKEFLLK